MKDKILLSREMLLARPLYVATPMYGGQCFGFYANSLLQLRAWMAEQKIPMEFFSIFNESAITRARNMCVHEFMYSNATHLLFWDADVETSFESVLQLIALADPEGELDVVCGLYPKKHINWEKVAEAAKRGVPPADLPKYASDLVFNTHGLEGSFNFYSPLEVTEVGTGFMMIQRHVFDRLAEKYPELWHQSDGREQPGRGPSKIRAFFENWIDPDTHRYLTEDYNFCRLVREAGMKVWVAPWLELNHLGHSKFIGNPQALSQLAEPAADAA
jgi:hypothetical protein